MHTRKDCRWVPMREQGNREESPVLISGNRGNGPCSTTGAVLKAHIGIPIPHDAQPMRRLVD